MTDTPDDAERIGRISALLAIRSREIGLGLVWQDPRCWESTAREIIEALKGET